VSSVTAEPAQVWLPPKTGWCKGLESRRKEQTVRTLLFRTAGGWVKASSHWEVRARTHTQKHTYITSLVPRKRIRLQKAVAGIR